MSRDRTRFVDAIELVTRLATLIAIFGFLAACLRDALRPDGVAPTLAERLATTAAVGVGGAVALLGLSVLRLFFGHRFGGEVEAARSIGWSHKKLGASVTLALVVAALIVSLSLASFVVSVGSLT